ncbi:MULTISPECIES: ABC transporter permease [Inquilinus]|uniref:ABC transport system permease protein n=1 Tax=Inquilinus ginsengisoli TaxID=363840 RepID=A0ABU1JTK2_9PROT|nr:FtsX-like permease family protein [Inquilinus ginsengisoli]MDR6291954.1 putative ABC transport system permease protein [Inquilinus ginsengisoli]
MTLAVAARLARRELRGGLKGFHIFLACLALGVGAIATVQSVADGIRSSIAQDGQAILGGDVALHRLYEPATAAERAELDAAGRVAEVVETRGMARSPKDESTTLVELKAVDGAYPLYGKAELDEGGDLQAALAQRDGVWGAVADPEVAARLGLAVGDRIAVGDAVLQLRGTIAREPDKAGGNGFSIGPRLMIGRGALDATGLVQPGSMLAYDYRLALPRGSDAHAFATGLKTRFPDGTWRIRDDRDAAPSLRRTIDQLTMYLTLVGLTALLVGGAGVGNAVRAWLDARLATIATLKCLGAPGRLIFETYLIQVLVLAGLGIVIGLGVGAAAPPAVAALIDGLLPVETRIGVYPGALLLAAGFGLLTALTFSLWPLARAARTPAAALFRDRVAPRHIRPAAIFIAATALCGAALAALAVATASDTMLAAIFVAGAIAAIGLFHGTALGVMALLRRAPRPRRPGLRLALANLHRPGAPTPQIVLSLGLGLTVLAAIALIQGNMDRQIQDTLPGAAPSFFFVDVQKSQKDQFDALIQGTSGASDLAEVPSLRGRIVSVNGVPVEKAVVDPKTAGWVLRGDRGITYATAKPPKDKILQGEWWPADYDGPPKVSTSQEIAGAFGLKPGDRMTLNVLGRDIDAEVANIREIDWGTLGINFTLIMSPKPLSAAPHTWLATVKVPPAAEPGLQRAVTDAFPNVTTVRLKDALETVNALLSQIGTAVRSTAGITLLAGALVLAGAVAAGHRRRIYDAVVLKVLGATRGDVMRAFLIEYGLLGLLTAAIACVLGTIAAWGVLTYVMKIGWTFLPLTLLGTAGLCVAITLGFGFLGTWVALGQKAAPLLRNE